MHSSLPCADKARVDLFPLYCVVCLCSLVEQQNTWCHASNKHLASLIELKGLVIISLGLFSFRYSWRLGAWSACTATCGIGIKARRIRCLDNYANRIVQNGLCKDHKPSEIEPCHASSCIEHSFFTEPWSRCSKTCDQG